MKIEATELAHDLAYDVGNILSQTIDDPVYQGQARPNEIYIEIIDGPLFRLTVEEVIGVAVGKADDE